MNKSPQPMLKGDILQGFTNDVELLEDLVKGRSSALESC